MQKTEVNVGVAACGGLEQLVAMLVHTNQLHGHNYFLESVSAELRYPSRLNRVPGN